MSRKPGCWYSLGTRYPPCGGGQGEGREPAEAEREARIEWVEDLPGAEVVFVRVGTGEVAGELVEGSLGQEVAGRGEGFDFEELVFEEAVDGFDIAWVGGREGRDALVWGAEETDGAGEALAGAVGREFADQFAAVVGLPGQGAEVAAAAVQRSWNALGKPCGGLDPARANCIH